MYVNIGNQTDHSFEQPLMLMRDCHRRIERFLKVLLRIVEEVDGAKLRDEYRRAMIIALDYFRHAAPMHTCDEEESLFPRLRELDDSRVCDALATVATLELDHESARLVHDEVDQLGRHWLELGGLAPHELARLSWLLCHLQQMYARHIAEEDNVIFPLAEELLSTESLAAIGREMAERRQLTLSPMAASSA